MISREHKFIFIHIPKTGGTSIEQALKAKVKGASKHRTVTDYENQLKSDIEKYFLFSVIRNPWDKLVSYWKYRQGKSWAPIDGKIKDFNTWLEFMLSLDLNNLKGKTANCNLSDLRTALDLQFNCLVNAKNNINVDLIRFENLQEDFDIVCDKIGIPQQQLPHKNKGKHKHYTEYYDNETRQIVAEKYAKDIEHFGYKFGE